MAFDKNGYDNDYKRANYDRLILLLPKGRKADIKAYADAKGMTMNQVIIGAVERQCKLDLSKRGGD